MLAKILCKNSRRINQGSIIAGLSAIFFSLIIPMSCNAGNVKVPNDKSKFHIFVLMGQSNMAGSGHPVLAEYKHSNPNVLILGRDYKWNDAVVKLGQGMGPGYSFARHYAELHPEVTVGLIQGARGGRSIKELSKGGKDRDGAPNYDNTMKQIKEAMKVGTLKGILWHQGESDCGDPKYVEKLKSLVDDLRADTGEKNVIFIAGELGRYATWTARFNNLIPSAKTAIPACGVVSSEGLMDLGDKVHFSGFSVEIMGSRYLMEYLKMKEPELAVKFKPALGKITEKMLAKDVEWETIQNPSMTDGDSFTVGWNGKWTSKGNLNAFRDCKDFASAPSSLRIESVGGPVTGSVSESLRNVCGKKLKITCKMKNEGFSNCTVVLTGMDGSWQQVLNKEVINAKEAKEWTTLSGEIFVPANAVNTRIGILVDGSGKVWLDDIIIEKSLPVAGANIVQNGAMTEGQDKPSSWGGVWTSSGKLKYSKDKETFKSAPSSLKIESDGGPVKGSVSQALNGVAGKTLKVKGWAKCKGPKNCSVGIGAFDDSWKMIKWINIFNKAGGDGFDWTEFEQVVTIPANATKVNLGLGIDDEGSLWFDDIEVSEVK